MIPQGIRPGDFAVISSRSAVGLAVDVAEFLSDGLRPTQFSHAVICSRFDEHGRVMIVEAMPGGAVERAWHYDGTDHLWSTGLISTPMKAGAAALRYVGWGYNWADYAAIAAHTWHLPFAPELYDRATRLRQLICSVLVDRSELDADCHLFADGRPPGYVRPSDLADLLLTAKGSQ